MEIIISSAVFLIAMFTVLMIIGRHWGDTISDFLFANRTLKQLSSGLAISSHWFWAIAIFVGPAVAYNWGLIGLLCFAIPNALSLIVVGHIARRLRDRYPDGYSLTQYIKDNFSARVGVLYQIQFVLISLAALLLGFTAISKLWEFTALNQYIPSIWASLVMGLITLAFTMRGGLRTSIFTGATQTVIWLVFLIAMFIAVIGTDVTWTLTGKNQLTTPFDFKFLTSFAVAFSIAIIIGATSHGMMWQKAFSMPKENVVPSFTLGAVIFGIIILLLGSLSLYAFSAGLPVTGADVSAMATLTTIGGIGALVIFATMLIGQTSTVMDSALNYISSLITIEWLKNDQVNISRLIMVAFVLFAWVISWAKLEIWTILMLMGAIRVVLFVPLVMHVMGQHIKEYIFFYASVVGIVSAVYLSYIARTEKLPIFDMYSALTALTIPTVALLISRLRK